MPTTKQWVAKHIPAEANVRNNRRYIDRERHDKQALLTIQTVFSWGPCKVDIRESISEAGSCGRTRMRIEGVQRSTKELACERKI
jgi:hypothetical protein